MDYDDVVQIGYLRLLRAAELWDDSRGTKFITYAYRAIQSGIYAAAKHHYERDFLIRAKSIPQEDWGRFTNYLPTIEDADTLVPQDAKEAWLRLPKRSRYIVWQTIVEGKPYAKVAKPLRITKERVRQLLCDALKWLADAIDGKKPELLYYDKPNTRKKKKKVKE